MAEKLCTLRTKGGGGAKYTETSLWTNSAPTSSFNNQNVTLSDSIDNYKYIKIVWKAYKSATTTSSVIVLVNDFKSFAYVANYTVGSLASNNSSNQPYARRYVYVSDTVIGFHDALRLYAAATNNDMAIPLEILGLNELDHGKRFDETTLWTNNAPTTGASSFTCTLSDDWTNYDYIKVSACLSTSSPTNVLSTMFAKDELAKCRTVSGTNSFNISLTLYLGSGGFYCRRGTANMANNATISFGQASQLGGTGTNSNYLIPVSIAGCKFR